MKAVKLTKLVQEMNLKNLTPEVTWSMYASLFRILTDRPFS